MSTDTPTRVTVADFETFIHRPENADRRFELIHGELVEKVTTVLHSLIVGKLIYLVMGYLQQHKLGRIGPEMSHTLPDDDTNVRKPDISILLDVDETPANTGALPRMPDVAIEVKSPSNSFKELRDKAAYYLANGTRMVWLVFPEKHIVEVYQHAHDDQLLIMGDTLDGGDVLPGFSLPIADVFEV